MIFSLAIHGGAGDSPYSNEQKEKYFEYMKDLLFKGFDMLKSGKEAVEVVICLVEKMEDSGIFNAGKGAVRSIDGFYQLDASIMNGENLKFGSVSNVSIIKNPIKMAEYIMNNTKHVKLECLGAERLAIDANINLVDPNKYYNNIVPNFGDTIGVVALDMYGNFAAASSTGGIQNKIMGRPSDISDIGAGIYANKIGAISCTGIGEFFQRTVLAYDIMAQVEYQNKNMADSAVNSLIKAKKLNNGMSVGGIMGIAQSGEIYVVYDTKNMFAGYINHLGEYGINL